MTKLNKYLVDVQWSGYSRGYSLYEVEAKCEDDAIENYYYGKEIERETIRDDTESHECPTILEVITDDTIHPGQEDT